MRLTHFEADIWETHHIAWKNILPDVNIVVGINGVGKTTLLNAIYDQIKSAGNCIYVRSTDNILMRDKRRENKANALTQELEYFFYDTKTGPSLMKMRAASYDLPDNEKGKVAEYENRFLKIVNRLFRETGKKIDLSASNPPVCIEGKNLPLSVLSSGEKQLLLLLLQVNLLMGQEAIVLIDEPENSMHISWQSELVNILTELNPNAQYIITTHSPSIFGDGWGDKVTYMEDIIDKK